MKYDCGLCDDLRDATQDEVTTHLLRNHEDEIRSEFSPPASPFETIDCHQCNGSIQENLRCDAEGHSNLDWWVGWVVSQGGYVSNITQCQE